MYTIYPIDAGAAFVTPATPAFSHHYDTGFTKTFVGRYLQVSMIQVLSPLWYSFYQKKSCLQIHIHVFLHTRQSKKFIIGHLKNLRNKSYSTKSNRGVGWWSLIGHLAAGREVWQQTHSSTLLWHCWSSDLVDALPDLEEAEHYFYWHSRQTDTLRPDHDI